MYTVSSGSVRATVSDRSARRALETLAPWVMT